MTDQNEPGAGTAGPATARETSQYAEAQRQIREQLGGAPIAHSLDGRSFAYEAPLQSAVPAGEFVVITTRDNRRFLGQVRDVTRVEREGPELTVEGDAGLGVKLDTGNVSQTSFRVRLQTVQGNGLLLGRLPDDGAATAALSHQFTDAVVALAPTETVSRYLASVSSGGAQLAVGRLQGSGETPDSSLLASGFGRHTFLCGQSGSGKTYSLGVILERLLAETDLQMVIIDPNSDYVHLDEVRPDLTTGEASGELAGGLARYQRAVAGLRVLRPASTSTAPDATIKIRFSDLSPQVQATILQLDPLRDRDEYAAYWTIVRQLGRDRYSLKDVQAQASASLAAESRQLALRIANLKVSDWSIWAEGDEWSLREVEPGWRALVLDVGGFSHPAEQSLVANALLNELWRMRDRRQATLVVIDEAHNICPQEPDNAIQALATERAIAIAGEGRKFGLYFLLSTQQPHKIHGNVLAQCDNLVLMRMNSTEDLQHLSRVFSFVPPALMDRSRTFAQGESLVAGKISPVPMLIRFGQRYSREGGGDVPATWASPAAESTTEPAS